MSAYTALTLADISTREAAVIAGVSRATRPVLRSNFV